MSVSGRQIPSEVNVAMAILVLPLNSALNPFLYTFNLLLEKLRAYKEKKLITMLEKEHKEIGDNTK